MDKANKPSLIAQLFVLFWQILKYVYSIVALVFVAGMFFSDPLIGLGLAVFAGYIFYVFWGRKPSSSNPPKKTSSTPTLPLQRVQEGAKEKPVIPNDNDFLLRGWVLGDWFNHESLMHAFGLVNGWEGSRTHLQKIAAEITRPSYPEAQKEWFKERMAMFVKQDPLYKKVIGQVKAAVEKQPGILQSSIYEGRSESDKEYARYVLYFANELGDIRREKHGRSYKLFPAAFAELASAKELNGNFNYEAAAKWVLRGSTLSEDTILSVAFIAKNQKHSLMKGLFHGDDFDWPWFDQCLTSFEEKNCFPDSMAWEQIASKPKLLHSKSEILAKMPGSKLKIIGSRYGVVVPSKAKVAEVRTLLGSSLSMEQLKPYQDELNLQISSKHQQKWLDKKYHLLELAVGVFAHRAYRYRQVMNMRRSGYQPAIDWGDDIAKDLRKLSNKPHPPFYPGDHSTVEAIPPKDSRLERILREGGELEKWEPIGRPVG